jgi:predicted Ser/Thr protein kinase
LQAGIASASGATSPVGSGVDYRSPTIIGTGFTPPEPQEIQPLFPQLEIFELLGKGGMGAVYKARQHSLDRVVAVKILPPHVASDPAFAERFTREAKALARLNHPHIVTVHDVGQADGLYYFVMEYVDGVNLRELIRSGDLSPSQALAIVPQICEALQYAHDEGIVHRDIKPENVLLDAKGRVKIADFGLAKLLGADRQGGTLTGTHQVMGTLRYMAPEQVQGSRNVDHRADIYALGVVFYELLTGEVPMGRFAPPSQKVQVDIRLDEVVLRALESEPEKRYQRAGDVSTDLQLVSKNLPTPGTRPKPFDERTSGTDPSPPFSQRAIIGGLLTLPFLFFLGAVGIEQLSTTSFGGVWPGLLMFSPLAVAACWLGGLAVRDIRSGSRTGLPMAVFDVLVLPLAVLNAVVVFMAVLVAETVVDVKPPDIPADVVSRQHHESQQERLKAFNEQLRIEQAHAERVRRRMKNIAGLIALPLCLLLNGMIALRVWRSLTNRSHERVEKPPAQDWPSWWRTLPIELRRCARVPLLVIYIVCLGMFFTFRASGGIAFADAPGNVRQERYSCTIGAPEPWFVVERHKDGHSSTMKLLSPTLLLILAAYISYGLHYRLRMIETEGRIKIWEHPNTQAAMWGSLAILGVIAAQLPLFVR